MLHVLLVDDNPSDVMLICEGIRRSHIPADVTVACDGEDAFSLLSSTHFDLVILDLDLPKLRGHALLDRCQRGQGAPPVVVFTGSDNPTDKEIALAFGAKDYVEKPGEFLQFMRAVKAMVEGCELSVRVKAHSAG